MFFSVFRSRVRQSTFQVQTQDAQQQARVAAYLSALR